MTSPEFRFGVWTLASCALLLATPAQAQSQPRWELVPYVDLESGLRISYPRGWRREAPAKGTVKVVVGEPKGKTFLLCTVEHSIPAKPLPLAQARVDQELVRGFKTRAWPQQLAGKRNVLDYKVREIGGVPMGAVDWDGTETRNGRQDFARGIKVFRMTPASLWTGECVAIALSKPAADAYFEASLPLIAEILDSLRFPPDRP